jgi:large subunit ribosomal protein L12
LWIKNSKEHFIQYAEASKYCPKKIFDTMEYVYAALLLHKLQKEVNEANISSVVKASGAEVNDAQVKALVAALADINIDDAVKAAPVAVAAAAPAAAEAAGEAKAEEKPKDEGKTEEAAMEGLSSLFG